MAVDAFARGMFENRIQRSLEDHLIPFRDFAI